MQVLQRLGKDAAPSILTETSLLTYPPLTEETDLLSTDILCIDHLFKLASPKVLN